MSSLFNRLKPGPSGSSSPGNAISPSKKNVEPEPEITPLQKMLQNAGPIRSDGSDKFFGLENFGNTCYCNSIMQALYYSVPFREHVVRYPPHSPYDTPHGGPPKIVVPIRAPVQNGAAVSPVAKPLSSAEVIRRRGMINSGLPIPPGQAQKPEDKPDSPEYKKKHAMLAGPILELNYENASSYGMEESAFTAMKDIFMALIANPSRSGVLSPQRFLEVFKRENEAFRSSLHQDAHEFYGLLLNAVITSVEASAQRMKELEPPKSEEGLAQGMRDAVTTAANAMGLNSGQKSPGTGWVHEIFEGTLTSETRCLTCETTSQRDESFLDLSIDLEEHSSVTSCLRKFSAEEMLCERNKFHCDNCGGLQEAEKRMKIKRLPKILALHLKRFKWTEDMLRLQKLFHRVVYPYYLRMFNTTDDAEDPDRLYELYAVVVHIGGNAYHGHYVSIIKTQDRGWLLFDDEMVEPVDKNYVRNFFGDKPGMACAYVLFYQETTMEAMRKEQDAEAPAEVALASLDTAAKPHTDISGSPTVTRQTTLPTSPSSPTAGPENPSLAHAITLPIPIPTQTPTTPDPKPIKTKLSAKEAKEAKDAEKARRAAEKAAEKAAHKEAERHRKDLEASRREHVRNTAEQTKQALALSKQTAAEEDERRRKEAASNANINANGNATAVGINGSVITEKEINGSASSKETNGNGNGNGTHEKEKSPFGLGHLARSNRGSKSMSRKSFGFLGAKMPVVGEKSTVGDEDAVEEGNGGGNVGNGGVPNAKKERFSFSLGRKKSHLEGIGR